MRPAGPRQQPRCYLRQRAVWFTHCSNLIPVRRHPRQPLPCRPSGASLSPSQIRQREVMTKKRKKEKCAGDNRKSAFSGRVRPSLFFLSVTALLSPSGRSTISSHSSSERARVTILPNFVPRRKVRAAGVACSSRKGGLTVGARGCFHTQAFPMLLHSSRTWGPRLSTE